MRVFVRIIFVSFCFITGLFSYPDLLAEERCISVTGRISAQAFVENPVGIYNPANADLDIGLFTLRIPEENTIIISINDSFESLSSDSEVSLISLDKLINSHSKNNLPCTLTVFFPHQ